MPTPLKVLIIEDSNNDALLTLVQLRRGGYDPQYRQIQTEAALEQALTDQDWDVILSDHDMPHFSSIEALQTLQATGKDIPFLIVSGAIGEETAVSALKAGADDFLLKDNLTRLVPAIERSIREAQERTEKRLSQQALLDSEARYRSVVDSNLIGILGTDLLTSQIVEANDAFLNMIGYTLEDLRSGNINWAELTPAEYRAVSEAAIAEVQEQGYCTPFEKQYVRKDGSRVDVFLGSTVQKGSPNRAITFVLDITHRKALAEREAFIHRIIQTVHGAIALDTMFERVSQELGQLLRADRCFICRYSPGLKTFDPPRTEYLAHPGIHGFLNVGSTAFPGYARALAHLLGDSSHPIPVPIDHPQLSAEAHALLEAAEYGVGVACNITYQGRVLAMVQVQTVSAERRWTEAELETIQAVANQTAVAIYQTELAEERAKAEERYSLVVAGSNDGVWDWDLVSGTLYWNDRMFEMLGEARTELLNYQYFDALVHPEDKDGVNRAMDRTLETGEPFMAEFRMRHHSGAYRYFFSRGKAYLDADGRPNRVSGLITDITDRKEAQLALNKILKRERLIRGIVEAISQSFDIDLILNATAHDVARYFQVDRCVIIRYERRDKRMVPVLSGQFCVSEEIRPMTPDWMPVKELEIPDSPMNRAAQIINIPDTRVSSDELGAYLARFGIPASQVPQVEEAFHALSVKSWLWVDITYRGMPYGGIGLHQCQVYRTWTDEEIALMRDLTTHLGIAFYQAELYQQEQRARNLAEAAEERYRLVVQGSNDGIWDFNLETREAYWNDRFSEMMGAYLPEADRGYDTFMEFVHPEDQPRIKKAVEMHLARGVRYEVEFRFVRPSGDYRYCVIKGKAFRNESGAVVRMSGTLTDVTERKQLELQLHLAKEEAEIAQERSDMLYQWERKIRQVIQELRQSLDVQDLMAHLVQRMGKILNVDRCFVIQFHKQAPVPVQIEYTAPGVLGMLGAVPAGHLADLRQALLVENVHSDSAPLDALWRAELAEWGVEAFAAVPILFHDELLNVLVLYSHTPRRWGESELRFMTTIAEQAANTLFQIRVKKQIERTSRLKSQFLANMSHELRTPLNAIIGYSEMLEAGLGGNLSEKQERYVHNVVVSGRHLLEMVNDILDVSRIEAGKLQLAYAWIEFGPFLTDVRAVLQSLAESRSVSLTFATAPDLVGFEADAARMRQIFINLVSNAIKFNREGGTVAVSVSPAEDGESMVCEVRDTGIGIAEDKLNELFTEFYQVDSSFSRQQEGTGLGLALTRQLIELHQGRISVESVENIGSTFTFTLPLRRPRTDSMTPDLMIPAASVPAAPLETSNPAPR